MENQTFSPMYLLHADYYELRSFVAKFIGHSAYGLKRKELLSKIYSIPAYRSEVDAGELKHCEDLIKTL